MNEKDDLEKQLNEAKREQAKLAANCRFYLSFFS